MNTQIDIIFVGYNSAGWVKPCLDKLSVVTYPLKALNLIFVENASGDDAPAQFRSWCEGNGAEDKFGSVTLIENEKNLGFGGGNNVGWRAGKSPLILFLNLDTEVEPEFLEPLVEAVERPPLADGTRIGFAGPKIYFPPESPDEPRRLQHAGGMIYDNGMSDHYFNGAVDEGQADEGRLVDFVTGACLLARRKAVEALGGFDEDFFPAYFEEADMLWRGLRLPPEKGGGWRTWYEPRSLIYHHESVALGGRQADRLREMLYTQRMRFVLKNWTLADFFERWLPAERWWFGLVESKAARPFQWRSYRRALAWLVTRSVSRGKQ